VGADGAPNTPVGKAKLTNESELLYGEADGAPDTSKLDQRRRYLKGNVTTVGAGEITPTVTDKDDVPTNGVEITPTVTDKDDVPTNGVVGDSTTVTRPLTTPNNNTNLRMTTTTSNFTTTDGNCISLT